MKVFTFLLLSVVVNLPLLHCKITICRCNLIKAASGQPRKEGQHKTLSLGSLMDACNKFWYFPGSTTKFIHDNRYFSEREPITSEEYRRTWVNGSPPELGMSERSLRSPSLPIYVRQRHVMQ